jgi:glycosyltransferase involved in cell wall biosynthesis
MSEQAGGPHHILFVTGEYPPATGGVGAYTAELARALVDRGLRANVLTGAVAGVPAFDDGDVPVYRAIRRWDWRIWRQVPGWAQRLGANWVHVQYQTAAYAMHPAVNFAPPVWRRAGLRVAWTYHDLLVPYLFPKAGHRLRRWATARPAFTSDLVIVTNEGDRLQLAGRAPRLAQIPIGSNIAGRTFTADERRQRRTERGYGEEDWVVGYFGFLNRSKGGTALVRALHALSARCPRAQLLMIGERVGASDPSNYAYLQEVEALIAQLGLAGRVQWTGHQDDRAVSADLDACDALLMPYEDGASLRRGTLMAGLAHGCALVTTTPHSPLPELIDGRDLLYVPAGDAQAMADALWRLAQEPDLVARLRSHARARSQLFTWEAIAAQHVALYTGAALQRTVGIGLQSQG